MQIVTVCFDYPDRPEFGILLDVFRHSVNRLMPNVEFIEIRPEPPKMETHRVPGFLDNTFKLAQWVKHLDNTKDNVIFIDCDMLALRSAEHAFKNNDFDIAFTGCPAHYKVPLNGGVLMARPTDRAREFLHAMKAVNDHMFYDPEFHEKWRKKYAGMNQSAFGYCYEKLQKDVKILKLTTREWNAIDCDLKTIDNKTVFLHIRQNLRNNLLANKPPFGVGKKAMQLWYAERERMFPGTAPEKQERLPEQPRVRGLKKKVTRKITIPSMGGGRLGPRLKKWAEEAQRDTAIVELGTWLGAGTEHLAQGGLPVHTYDIFEIRGNEVAKARPYGFTFVEGEDSLPFVQKALKRFDNITYHKGEIEKARWKGGKISVYVDDACKYEPAFIAALKIFSPSWIPGETVCVFMDFWWHLSRPKDKKAKFQKNFIMKNSACFDFIMDDQRLGVAAFRYKGGLNL